MNKLRKIQEFLENINTGVAGKVEAQRTKIAKEEDRKSDVDYDYLIDLRLAHEYTKGQLYEIGFILDNFWDIINQKNH